MSISWRFFRNVGIRVDLALNANDLRRASLWYLYELTFWVSRKATPVFPNQYFLNSITVGYNLETFLNMSVFVIFSSKSAIANFADEWLFLRMDNFVIFDLRMTCKSFITKAALILGFEYSTFIHSVLRLDWLRAPSSEWIETVPDIYLELAAFLKREI